MSLMFDSPLGKKLTESETVIAELVVEDITAWLDEMLSLHHKKFNPLKKRCNYRKLLRDWYAALRGLFWL